MKHWRWKDIVIHRNNLRENNDFYFSVKEILSESQIYFFFGRLKRDRQTNTTQTALRDEVYVKEKLVKESYIEIDEEGMDSDLQE